MEKNKSMDYETFKWYKHEIAMLNEECIELKQLIKYHKTFNQILDEIESNSRYKIIDRKVLGTNIESSNGLKIQVIFINLDHYDITITDPSINIQIILHNK